MHRGELDASLQPGLEKEMRDFEEEAKHVDEMYFSGFAARFVAKDQENEGLSDVEKKLLRQGYTAFGKSKGLYEDADGNVAVFSQGRMRATSGALKKKFLDTLPPAKRRLAEEYIASGKVDVISPEELEEHRRAGAAIAERVYDRISSEYQTFKKEQLEKEREKREEDGVDAKKAEKDAQLRKPILTKHPHQESPTLEDASKESQEKTAEKDKEKTDQMLKNVKDSKIETLRLKDDKDRIKHISNQQEQKEEGQRIDIEEQKKKEEPPRAPPKGTNTSPA